MVMIYFDKRNIHFSIRDWKIHCWFWLLIERCIVDFGDLLEDTLVIVDYWILWISK